MFDRLVQATIQANTFLALKDAAYGFFQSIGANRLGYHHQPPIGAIDAPEITIAAVGFPDRWVKTYIEKEYYRVDPIARYVGLTTRPFRCSEIASLTRISPREQAFLKELDRQDLGDGLAAPVFGPHGRDGYFSVGFEEQHFPQTTTDYAHVQFGCQLVHLRYCELLQSELPKAPELSIQERAVLREVALGSTNSQIADALNISRKTVATYVARCFDKLDVHDRMTAAMRALSSGLLD